MWLTPYSSSVRMVASASSCVTREKAAAPKMVRVDWWPVRPKGAVGMLVWVVMVIVLTSGRRLYCGQVNRCVHGGADRAGSAARAGGGGVPERGRTGRQRRGRGGRVGRGGSAGDRVARRADAAGLRGAAEGGRLQRRCRAESGPGGAGGGADRW